MRNFDTSRICLLVMCAHSVENHLRVPLEEYDRAIRAFVPYYDELLQTGVEILSKLAPPNPSVLELGCGTGRFSQAILRGLPSATLTVLDIDPEILKMAEQRLGSESHRVRFLKASFFEPLPAADLIVASLSLHHIHDLDEKTRLYGSIRKTLNQGGVFLCLDAAVSVDPKLSGLTFDHWMEFMGKNGISPAEARNHLKAWESEDKYFPIHQELIALARAGFDQPECFWRRGPMAIYGGLVPAQSG
ncbi:MAG: class I SAM-dependent methyltransferase [Bdellovibrionota bacterium]